MSAKKSPDIWLFSITVALLGIGVFMVFNSSYARAGQVEYTGGDSLYFFKRQVVYAAIGLAAMFAGMRMRYWKLKPLALVLLFLSIIGLGLVLIPGLGVMVNGAYRWIRFGGITIQPSEFAKLALIIYLAALLATKKQEIRHVSRGLLPALIPLVVLGALIMRQPDMGTTMVLAATTFAMIFMAGARKIHLSTMAIGGVVMAALLVFTSEYRLRRVISYFDPFSDYHGSGYQVSQSLIALGSGGVFGVGLCEGREKLFYLPAEYTDFIFAVLGEEMGLIGTLGMASLFLWLGVRGFMIAYRTKNDFGRLLAGGISTMICGQALLSMLVVTASVPATGVPLPLISYGGSSLVLNLLCIGILLGISQYPGKVETYDDESGVNRRRNRRTRVPRRKYR